MTARKKNMHCSYCGHPFEEGRPWPRTCGPCGNISYLNPLPVAVALAPVDGGLLCIRRTIEPGVGELALPGGFLDVHETWQEGCARELREETGVTLDAGEVKLFRAYSDTKGYLLLFGLFNPRRWVDLPAFESNEETSEMCVVREPVKLAFPLHTLVMEEFFREQRGLLKDAP